MTARGTALLLAVLAALGLYVLLEYRRPATLEPEQAPPLLRVAAADVARIEVDDADGRLIAVRGPSGWTDGAGRAWQGDAPSDLLDVLATLGPVMVVDPAPENPADYGLGPDAPRLTLTGAGGTVLLALEVGERNPAWTGLYARAAGEQRVLLVGAVLHWELEKLKESAPGS
ncbi:MAG TPA: DUF4340 domain-containing protein [Candidatus Binatia bacterium]|nr:DUF4340 domain-containing protein [Candidatus Binatia bacterium]